MDIQGKLNETNSMNSSPKTLDRSPQVGETNSDRGSPSTNPRQERGRSLGKVSRGWRSKFYN